MKEKVKSKLFFEIENLIQDDLKNHDYQLIDIEFKGGVNKYLTLFVYKNKMDIEALGNLSKHLYPLIEKHPLLKEGFNLEISSPGIFRVIKYFKEFDIFSGRTLSVTTITGTVFTGISNGINDQQLLLSINDENRLIPLNEITKARLNG